MTALLAILTFLFIALCITLARIIFTIYINIQGAPYAVSRNSRIKDISKLLQKANTEEIVDLGSGDGRVLIASIRAGAKKGIGYEIDPVLVYFSRRNIKKAGLESKITIHRKSFWEADLSKHKTIVVYAAKHVTKRLEEKLRNDLTQGSHVISAYFTLPNLKPHKKENDVYLYKIQKTIPTQ